MIGAVRELDQTFDDVVDDPEIATRISQYEMAFRMQASVPELADWSDEPKHILKMYGVERPDGSFASNCLMARRLAERGVRFIQLYHRGWDHHKGIEQRIRITTDAVDHGPATHIMEPTQPGAVASRPGPTPATDARASPWECRLPLTRKRSLRA